MRSYVINLKKKTWSLYIIRTNAGHLYTGIAKNVAARFKQHKDQGKYCAKYLKGKAPLSLVYTEVVGDYSSALKREHQVKKLPKNDKEKLILTNKI